MASLTNVALGATRGFGSMGPTVAIERLGRAALQLLLVGVGVLVGTGAIAVLGWAASYLPAAILALWWLRRKVRASAPAAGTLAPGVFWRFTAPRALAAVSQVILQRLDIILVAALKGPADAAVYAAATRFLVVGQLGVQALSNAVQPALSGALAVGHRERARVLYQTSTAWLVLLVWPMFLSALVFSPVVLAVFGRGYAGGRPVMIVLALAMLVATACGFVDIVLIMAGRSSWSLINTVIALIVNVTVDLLLIPPLGVTGAAIGWAVAIGVNNLVPLVQVRRSVGIHPFGRGVVLASSVAAVLFGVVPGLVVLASGSLVVGLVVLVPCIAAYVAVVWREREQLGLDRLLRPRRRVRASATAASAT
jgi:O-antigen/teichoic acid export membrane protein